MGDRANVVVRDNWPDEQGEKEAVFLYSHWGGTELPEVLRQALVRGEERWSDGSYLARIIFAEMIKGDPEGSTGFGISTRLTDNEYHLIVVIPSEEAIVLLPEEDYRLQGFPALDGRRRIPFRDLVAVTALTWDILVSE